MVLLKVLHIVLISIMNQYILAKVNLKLAYYKHVLNASILNMPLGWQGGQSATPDSEQFAKNQEKEGKIRKIEKKRKNWEEKTKIGKVLSLCPSWQIGLATLLILKPVISNKWKKMAYKNTQNRNTSNITIAYFVDSVNWLS